MTHEPQLHWEQTGSGPPVLCLSGFASSNWMLLELLEPLRDRGCFILPDNRGMGRSPPARAAYSLADLAMDGLQLMDRLGHEQFAVIGLSMGGFVAQLLTLAAPRRVERLVLLCTSSAGAAFKPLFPILPRQQVAELYHLPPAERIQAALSPALCPLLSRLYPALHEAIRQKRLANLEDPGQVMLQYDAVAAFLEQPLPLADIRCPTLLLAGEQDWVVPVANGEQLARSIPNARLTIVPDTDHLFFLEKREEVGAMIARLLD
ncbi:MAG: alpha/beta hydrolase [Magnetococcales bacterium]|nr:alpha/beta hydrolase [Magnetococcales bacterium]